jgi:hypothetical protein
MDKDRIVGSGKQIKGSIKVAAGKAVSNAKLQGEGRPGRGEGAEHGRKDQGALMPSNDPGHIRIPEVYLGGAWHILDPRNNVPRSGRVLIARGSDAAEVAISNTFGPIKLLSFAVVTDEITGTSTA